MRFVTTGFNGADIHDLFFRLVGKTSPRNGTDPQNNERYCDELDHVMPPLVLSGALCRPLASDIDVGPITISEIKMLVYLWWECFQIRTRPPDDKEMTKRREVEMKFKNIF